MWTELSFLVEDLWTVDLWTWSSFHPKPLWCLCSSHEENCWRYRALAFHITPSKRSSKSVMNSHFSLHIQSDFNLVIVGDTGPMSCTNPQIQADALQTLWSNRIWSLCSIQFKWTSFSKSLLSLNVPHVPPSTNPLPPISLSVFDFVLLKHFIFTNSVLILGSPKACPCGEQ